METRRRILWIVPVAVIAVLLVYPYEKTVVPAASIVVLDESGKVVPNAVAKQEWIDATVENSQHVDFAKSNETGRVAFPRRTKRAPLGLRIISAVWNVLTQGVHANLGSSSAITVYSNDPYVWAWTAYRRNGDNWPDQMKLERTDTAIYQ